MPRRKKTELPKAELNITSMMDLVLNLLMFFVLTSNFAMAELPSLEPPTFANSKARAVDRSNQVTVSLVADKVGEKPTGRAAKVKVGTFEMLPTEMGALSDHLAKEKAKDAEVTIEGRVSEMIHRGKEIILPFRGSGAAKKPAGAPTAATATA